MTESRTKEYRHIIVPIVQKYLPNARIILYGSRARQDDHPGSDIDVALDAGTKVDWRVFQNILIDLEESVLPVKFDLVDMHSIPKNLRREILKDGIIWHQ